MVRASLPELAAALVASGALVLAAGPYRAERDARAARDAADDEVTSIVEVTSGDAGVASRARADAQVR